MLNFQIPSVPVFVPVVLVDRYKMYVGRKERGFAVTAITASSIPFWVMTNFM
jgi:hypothetical protein